MNKKRILNRDGNFNVVRRGRLRLNFRDLYHSLLRLPWTEFFALVTGLYLLINLVFACGYFLCGPDALEGVTADTWQQRFLHAFFFSVQTFATIGYGKISPHGWTANTLVAIEALLSLLSLGLVTGILFARFARPTARIVFSDRALITKHEGVPSFVFRMGNQRLNQILEATVRLTFSRIETTAEGDAYRVFYDLDVERGMTPIFALSWTVVHSINERSPIHGLTHDELVRAEAEFIVTISGIDDTFSQTIHSRYSYVPDEIVWGGRFKDILSRAPDGRALVNLDEIHVIEPPSSFRSAGT